MPDLGEAIFMKAELNRATCHFEEATEHYQAALEAGFETTELHKHWRDAIDQAGKHGKAIQQYERAIERHGDDQGATRRPGYRDRSHVGPARWVIPS